MTVQQLREEGRRLLLEAHALEAELASKRCGKQGCRKTPTHKVHGTLLYYSCEEHIEELRKLEAAV